MKAIRILLAILLFCGIAGALDAKSVNEILARQVALNAWTERVLHGNPGAPAPQVASVSLITMAGIPVCFVFNIQPEPAGFILISADDAVVPVLGFSASGFYDGNRPPAFDDYVHGLGSQVLEAIRMKAAPDTEVASEWQRYGSPAFHPAAVRDVGPLIQTHWNQGCFYNEYCPADATASSTCYHALTGCGATAMAQILRFWSYPAHGTGSYGYTHPVYGYLFADFSAATYNYSAMPVEITSSNTEVAELIYHCGVAQVMDYGPDGSSSDIEDIDDAFISYFDYSSALNWKERALYSSSAWESMLKTELDAGRPVFYFGNDGGTIGHAFICDGYQGSSYFHFNWGWSGTYDGYFYLSDLTPGSNEFTYNQHAIFNLEPNQLPGPAEMDFESVSDFSLSFPPWTVVDGDGSATYAITDHTFPHDGEAMAFIAFNPAQVSPSMSTDTEIQPHGGSRFGACFSATTPPNNDWFISPQVQLNTNGSFTFWVKSYTDTYGLEKYKVAVSTAGNNPSDFTVISGTTPLEAPTDWTQMTYSLSGYNNQAVYVAIQCVSSDAFIFMIDDLVVDAGSTGSLVADFSASQTTVNTGQTVNFTDLSSGNPTSWQWTFPGGTPATSTAQDPANIKYNTPGVYDVTLTVGNGSTTNTKIKYGYITVVQALPSQMSLDFESLADFAITFDPWTVADVDGSETYVITDHTFPHNGDPMAFIAFNPAQVDPSLSSDPEIQPHGGSRYGACFSAINGPNNDWLISPQMRLNSNGSFSLWVKSYTDTYGLEKYKVGVSTTGNSPANFTVISGTSPLEAPVDWTKKTFDLSAYQGQAIYIGIQCVSDDAFIFMIDDLSITSTTGIEEEDASGVTAFPNPARNDLNILFSDGAPGKCAGELFNALGAGVRSFTDTGHGREPFRMNVAGLPEGIYFLKLTYDSKTLIKKVIILE